MNSTTRFAFDQNSLNSFGGNFEAIQSYFFSQQQGLQFSCLCNSTARWFFFQSIGIIRGKNLAQDLNPTLQVAQDFGMQLHFVSRAEYRLRHESEYLQQLQQQYPQAFIIPEGGTNTLAIQGTQEILTSEDRKIMM